jgi:hypothetical protein
MEQLLFEQQQYSQQPQAVFTTHFDTQPFDSSSHPVTHAVTPPPTHTPQAKEYGEAEVWMNERMSRTSPASCAEFLGAFLDEPSTPVGPAGQAAGLGGCVWLVWRDEGDFTLYDMMRQRDFPFNLEPVLLDRPLRLPQDKRRRLVSFKLVLAELLEALEAAHATGIGEEGG